MSGERVDKRQLRGATPDAEDRKNIVRLIAVYDKVYPYPHIQSLQRAIMEAHHMTGDLSSTQKKWAYQANPDAPRLAVHLPQPFVLKLKKAYPLIFSDKTQYDWFCKNFPNLIVSQ